MFLINNLQFYLQVDVIETEYCHLISEIQKIKDFQQIEKLHNIFLLNILSHSFLLDVPVSNEFVLRGVYITFFNFFIFIEFLFHFISD